jgi:hypothetical protein
MAAPGDQLSLLVPIHLDAWVVTSQNTQGLAWYYANYQNLQNFKSPIPGAFDTSEAAKPAAGVHLHWALPDALTKGVEGSSGTTSNAVTGRADAIALAHPAATAHPAGTRLSIHAPDGATVSTVVVRKAVAKGDTAIVIEPRHFGRGIAAGSVIRSASPGVKFPYVPNRWLISRFHNDAGKWKCKMWVVRSDFLTTTASLAGPTSASLDGTQTSIPIAAPGVMRALVAGQRLEILSPDGTRSAIVTTSQAVPKDAAAIPIDTHNFAPSLPPGSSVRLSATSAFLDPERPTFMLAEPGKQTVFDIQNARIGASYTIEAWEGEQDRGGSLFLEAVGPGDATFSAYVPLVRDVFSFTDTDLPAEGSGEYRYTYQVTGWYSDPATADPMRGVNVFIPGVWKNHQQWEKETPAQRFATLLNSLEWTASAPPATPPSTSLYHSLVSDVAWPYKAMGHAEVDPANVMVAVGNTSIDAVSALINGHAQQEALKNPNEKNQWLQAGETLANLMQAAQYDLLKDYGKPGGAALIEQKILEAWYGSEPGGAMWDVVAIDPDASGEQPPPHDLTPDQKRALDRQLGALNSAQRSLNQRARQLASLQTDLYMMWWKIGRANSFAWGEAPNTTPTWDLLKPAIETMLYPELFESVWQEYCAVADQQSTLPDSKDDQEANRWADAHWTFPKADGGSVTLSGLNLRLKPGSYPRFFHPNDPVVMISGLHRAHKHGEDGRLHAEGKLFCRLPGETTTGIKIPGQPQITVAGLQAKGVNLDPCGPFPSVPAISSLVHEAFLADPLNAPIMAQALGGNTDAIAGGIRDLMQQNQGSNAWIGVPPVHFALELWTQAWSPLFLEWAVRYYPTGTGSEATREFSLSDWTFNGEQYTWNGTGFDLSYLLPYKGRTFLTPQAPLLLKAKIQEYLKGHPDIDSEQLKQLIAAVADWDLVSQSLSGLSNQLITTFSQEAFPPPPLDDMSVACPPDGPKPGITALIGGQFRELPVLQGSGANVNYFNPVRGGLLTFSKLQVVDAFGQTYDASRPNTPQGFLPYLGHGLTPTNPPANLPFGALQLPPRIIQATQLDVRFNSNDGSHLSALESGKPNGICGWLLPNHLDAGLAIYDDQGLLLGELLPLAEPNNWRPRPGPPGPNPPPPTPADIANRTLRGVVMSIAAQTPAAFRDVLRTIDQTLWMVDPLGGRKDQFLSVLIGRPLAVVEAQLSLQAHGNPAVDRTWDKMVTPDKPPFKPLADTGVLTKIPFPVRLGSLQLRDDGLIGYYLPSKDYSQLYTVHLPDKIGAGAGYLIPIVKTEGGRQIYQGDLYLRPQVDTVTVAMILDPRGTVHGYTGLLPVTTTALPGSLVEDFIRGLKVTFRTGPVIADPGTLRLPQPAEEQGVWNFLQLVQSGWVVDPIVDADDRARLPDDQLQLREGWLELSGLN